MTQSSRFRGTRVERILGVTEQELVKLSSTERQQFLGKEVQEDGSQRLQFIHCQTGALTPIGPFTTPTLQELSQQLPPPKEEQSSNKKCPFYCLYHIDIGELQTRLQGKDCCMVQIAGNFNCLNGANRYKSPQDGTHVELAHQRKTQGPAATFGALACNLYRTHFVPIKLPKYNGNQEEQQLGQTLQHQINLLDNVTKYTGQPINGKLTLTGHEQSIPKDDETAMDEIAQKIRIGLQTDCRIEYGRDKRGREVCLLDTTAAATQLPMVDQCHAAAVNWNSLTHNETDPAWTRTREKQTDIETLSRTVLRAAYEGIYLAALVRQRRHLYLTLVGGGVFGNPNALIVQELARAHKKWANHPASCLQAVYLCAYSPKDNVEGLLRQQGIDIVSDSKQRG